MAHLFSSMESIKKIITILSIFYIYMTESSCPNGCSQHGQCITDHICLCDFGWSAADCSERICPADVPWTSYASADNVVRSERLECSNMGTCNRSTGECICRPGFEGPACNRLACPATTFGVCDGHGICKSMRDAALHTDGFTLLNSVEYNNWDADKIYGCVCDDGYKGYDCSVRSCSKGDDPLTTTGVDEIQTITCSCESTCTGGFKLSFQEETTALINYNDDDSTISNKLSALTAIPAVTISLTNGASVCDSTSGGAVTAITFTHNSGNLILLSVKDNTLASTGVGTPSLNLIETQAGTKEYSECSNRGQCHWSGQCQCYLDEGFDLLYTSSAGDGSVGNIPNCGYVVSPPISSCPTPYLGTTVCSGNGVCTGSPKYKCSCYTGYTGAACEYRECMKGKAWFDEASGENVAHAYYAECSNRGICDRTTGTCACQTGFTGSACQRLDCAGVCNYRGSCLSMSNLAQVSSTDGVPTPYGYGDTASTWDHDMILGCHCDKAWYHGPHRYDISDFAGYNCTLLTCPTGDDPETGSQVNEVQRISCSATGGSFTVSFRGETSTPISSTASESTLANALSKLKTVRDVTVSYSSGSSVCSGSAIISSITFLQAHGDLPNLSVDATSLTGGSASVSEHTKGTKENVECSNRGVCNRNTGVCACFTGYSSSDGAGSQGSRGDCGYRSGDYWYATIDGKQARATNSSGTVV